MSSWSWSAAPLPIRTGADPRWPSKWSDLLRQLGATVDAVHDLQRPECPGAVLAEAPAQPLHERRALIREPEPQQRVEREGGVADPGVAVVPVAATAELLGQAGRRRRDDPAGGQERQQLERQRRAVHDLTPPALVARLGEPVAPVLDGPVERLARLVL